MNDEIKYFMWSSKMYELKDEATYYDESFQPYGTIYIMKTDGSDNRQFTENTWEDSMPIHNRK